MRGKKNNDTIIIFTLYKWGNKYEASIKFLAKELVKEYNVIFINGPYTMKDFIFNFRKLFKSGKYKKLLPFSSGVEDLYFSNGTKITIINPPILLPTNSIPEGNIYNFLHKINHLLIASRVKKALKAHRIKDYIFINSFNFLYESLDMYLKPTLNVYYCVDEQVKPQSLKHGYRQENEIISRSDLVIVTSEGLLPKKMKMNPNCKVVNNAADISHFLRALKPETVIPDFISKLLTPIIGYYGVIERRFDFITIKAVAEKHPEWSFVLIGSVQEKYIPQDFDKIKNIHFIGYQPYEVLPEILKGIDVAMIPYKKDEVSNTIYPLKINEYLGAGKPVVATVFNEDLLDKFDDVVYFAKDDEEFAKGIELGLQNNSEEIVKKRLAVASKNSWSHRAIEFSNVLEDAIMTH